MLYGHTNPWDHLPGTLMVREAGGAAAHRDGTPYDARSTSPGLVVAADPATLAARAEPHVRTSGRNSPEKDALAGFGLTARRVPFRAVIAVTLGSGCVQSRGGRPGSLPGRRRSRGPLRDLHLADP